MFSNGFSVKRQLIQYLMVANYSASKLYIFNYSKIDPAV